MKHFRRKSGVVGVRRFTLHWYENTTNYDGWLSLATNIFLPALTIYAHAWVNRFDDDEREAGTERTIEVNYSWRLFGRWRDLRLGLNWKYSDLLPEPRRYTGRTAPDYRARPPSLDGQHHARGRHPPAGDLAAVGPLEHPHHR